MPTRRPGLLQCIRLITVRNAAIIAYTLSLKSVVSLPSTRLLRQNQKQFKFAQILLVDADPVLI
jgi:hypothetical protein